MAAAPLLLAVMAAAPPPGRSPPPCSNGRCPLLPAVMAAALLMGRCSNAPLPLLPAISRSRSSVQASKLIKQAGDRVLLFYERPAGQNQTGAAGQQENVGPLDDSTFPQTFDEDSASLLVDPEGRELDSEFEDLACEVKPAGGSKDDIFLPVNQSPKRLVGNLSTKSLGSISPILSRKPNPPGSQGTSKVQTKVAKIERSREPGATSAKQNVIRIWKQAAGASETSSQTYLNYL
ncbi:unnamed protein product [Ranitomeya imitator]|uniref:Uncharacterized protein n=1 Tax=Ranitomeya imitator TaxID=111125 RepID=A0ABN9LY44_9NEOB|nr:unnamed protein product [Ranitomeya imitator]